MILINSDDKHTKPKNDEFVIAVNKMGYLGLALWSGEYWFDACAGNRRIKDDFKWIYEQPISCSCQCHKSLIHNLFQAWRGS